MADMKTKVGQVAVNRELLMTMLKRHRLAKGLTQEALGKKVDRSAASVSEWESGKSLPDPRTFPRLARVLGIDPMALTKVIEPDAATV